MSDLAAAEFDRLCLERWPEIPWLEPISIVRPKEEGWACRLCVARNGLKAADPLYATVEEAAAHVAEAHVSESPS